MSSTDSKKDLKLFIISSLTVVSIVAFLFALTGAIHVSVKHNIVHSITSATLKGDVNALKERTDWNALRESIKLDLEERTQSEYAKSAGLNLSKKEIHNLVDFYIRPENVPMLFYYHSQFAPDIPPRDFIRSAKMLGFKELVMNVAYPAQDDRPWIESLEPVQIVFRLDNSFKWRLVDMNAPFYVIPRQAPLIDPSTGSIKPLDKTTLKKLARERIHDLEKEMIQSN